ncbi:MAG: hypothetical protein AAGC55_26325 [Myxococcota bacterium]
MTDSFRPAQPHGDLREVLPDVFFVTGGHEMIMDMRYRFSRNMTVVRHGGELTLINNIRLSEAGLAALEALGTVTHLMKIGAFHSVDDAFYLDRYRPQLWALPDMELPEGRDVDHLLSADGPLPVPDASLHVLASSARPEAIVRLDRAGGVLIACDSLQNWAEVDEYFDEATAARMTEMGFIRPANIGPGWLAFNKPEPIEFARIKELEFRHLLSGHGTPLLDTAHEQLCATFARIFEV